MNRLYIDNYYGQVIIDIDYITESYIIKDQAREDFYNGRRVAQQDVAISIKNENLDIARLQTVKELDGELFVVEIHGVWHLVKAAKPVSKENRTSFKELLQWLFWTKVREYNYRVSSLD